MKSALVDLNEITVALNDWQITLSEKDLVSILKCYFSSLPETTKSIYSPSKPIISKCFRVNPLKINKSLFIGKRNNPQQEKTRTIILQAFTEVAKDPNKYLRTFQTLVPIKKWDSRQNVQDLFAISSNYGGHMANWIEQALEWAYRITIEESWDSVCNNIDSIPWHRAVIWDSGCIEYVGGIYETTDGFNEVSASYVSNNRMLPDALIGENVVPLIVISNPQFS